MSMSLIKLHVHLVISLINYAEVIYFPRFQSAIVKKWVMMG
jgi:hypothetical protein